MDAQTIRTRFAPSPTGYLHVGGVRTALFAWLVAKQRGGQFILRLEDTDRAREVAGSDQHIMDSLHWLGIDWDEGPDKGGLSGPYRQSERLESYHEWAQKLVTAGKAYADTSTPEELDELRRQAQAAKRPFLFRDHRPANPPSWDGSQPLRLKSDPKSYAWHDQVMGDLSTGPEVIDDFILMKSDGWPTYNFAHIIDDHLMKITHVIRSQEFIASVPKYLNLYDALEIDRPQLATVPYVMGPAGNKKLSKRDGAKDILDYSREGYLPEAMANFLATLGWNDGTEQEVFTIDELIKKFDLSRVQRGGARFDEQRLVWLNGQHIRRLPIETLTEQVTNFWPPEAKEYDDLYREAVLRLVHERLKFFSELPELTRFFFVEPMISKEQLASKKLDVDQVQAFLETVHQDLQPSDFSEQDLETRLRSLVKQLGTKPSILFGLIRVAITGQKVAPGLFETMHVLGKQKSLDRLEKASTLLA